MTEDLERRLSKLRGLQATAPRPPTLVDLEAGHRRRRRRRVLATTGVLLLAVSTVAAIAAAATSHDRASDVISSDDVPGREDPSPMTSTQRRRPPTPSTSTPSAPHTATTTTESSTTITSTSTGDPCSGIPRCATVPSPDRSAPCATGTEDSYGGDDPAHPERAPLLKTASFGSTRWALCGASTTFSHDLLNLRSINGGITWAVTNTGITASRSHAGDRVDITFDTAERARIHIKSLVIDLDTTYTTSNGGRTWTPGKSN